MSTNRHEAGGASVRADMGAQYLSLDGAEADCAEVADMLVKEGTCTDVAATALSSTPERPSGKSWRHLAGTGGGVNDALKTLLDQASAEPHYEKRLSSLDEQNGCWRARPFNGAPGVFDAVVLAVPGCGVGGDNLLKIHGGWESLISAEQNKQLMDAGHDARWSFALYLPLDYAPACDAFFGPTAVERVVDDGTLHLLCYQSRKTSQAAGSPPEGGLAIVAHTTLAWAKRNMRASGRDERLLREISEHVIATLGLGSRASRELLGTKVITWKQSQVTHPVPFNPRLGPCMVLSANPPLVLAGDYFTESNFGGCLKSGFAAANLLAGILKGETPAAVADSAGSGCKGQGSKGKQRDGGKGKGRESRGWNSSEKEWQYGGYDNDWNTGSWGKAERKGGSKGGKGGKKGYAWKPYVGA